MEQAEGEPLGFFQYVFKFGNDEKAVMLNIIQHTLLAIIPIVVLLKVVKAYVPEADENKESFMILFEIVAQLCFMFLSFYFILRMISFIPTYSEVKYPKVHVLSMILPVLLITMTMQTKLGDKVQIIVDRISELYYGKEEKKSGKKAQVRVSQPMAPQLSAPPSVHTMGMQSPQMTNNKSMTNEYSINPQMATQNSPNFNSMYGGPTTPMQNAATPGDFDTMEPMAANDLGFSSVY